MPSVRKTVARRAPKEVRGPIPVPDDSVHLQVFGLTRQQLEALDRLVDRGMFGGTRPAVMANLLGEGLRRTRKWWEEKPAKDDHRRSPRTRR